MKLIQEEFNTMHIGTIGKLTNPMNKTMLTRIKYKMTNGWVLPKLILHQPMRNGANTLERKAWVPRESSLRELVTISQKG